MPDHPAANSRPAPQTPTVLGNTADLTAASVPQAKVAWKLDFGGRGLDSNLIRLPEGGGIAGHIGGEVDVLVHVITGSGWIGAGGPNADAPSTAIRAGDVLWLPRQSWRSINAGPDGLSYLTVHSHREPTLTITPAD